LISLKSLRFAVTAAILLALFVVMLGAYTRLTDAGLGCPDWPGCYGHMVLPSVHTEPQTHFPNIPIESRKAWTEMAHRYAAGTLALLILGIGLSVLRGRRQGWCLPWTLPLALIGLVVFQAALGMWTVTLKLLPVVVMGHLLGGILIFSCLCYFRMQISPIHVQNTPRWRFWISLGIVLVFCQIALGGWVSSNYAGVACIGFPQCNGEWFPALHFSQGFNLFSPVGANYQGGVLDNDVRMTIQFIHRIGAMIVGSYLLILSILLMVMTKEKYLQRAALFAVLFVSIQFVLGVANVIYLLPLWVAVMHNGVAALLLATMLVLRYLSTGGAANDQQY
jgi:cytochrome c oxidase assembly protein subunit 15